MIVFLFLHDKFRQAILLNLFLKTPHHNILYLCKRSVVGWVKERNPISRNDDPLWVNVIAFCEVNGKMAISYGNDNCVFG